MLSPPRHAFHFYPRRALCRRQGQASAPRSRNTPRQAQDRSNAGAHHQALWRVGLYGAAFALLSITVQPRVVDTLSRQLEALRAPKGGFTATVVACVVLRALVNEIDEQFLSDGTSSGSHDRRAALDEPHSRKEVRQ